GDRVMNFGFDATLLEELKQTIPVFGADDVKVIHMFDAGTPDGSCDKIGNVFPSGIEVAGVFDTGLSDKIELSHQPIGNDSLDSIESAIDPKKLNFISINQPMISVKTELTSEFVRASGDHSTVCPDVEVFKRVQAVGCRLSPRTHGFTLQFSADGLAGILEDHEFM